MPGYRIEVSPNNRAGCKSTECKKENIKITKGEIRFGSFVEINEHQSWQYKHWGCVTPKVISNVKDLIEGDFELLDGYEDLSDEWKEKVEKAVGQGHVDDEDWRGDVEKNRPGQSGYRVKTPKKKAKKEADDEEASPAKKKRKTKNDAADPEAEVLPAKKQRGRQKKEAADEDNEAKAPPKKRVKKAKEEDAEEDAAEPAPKKRSKKVKPEDAEENEVPKKKAPRAKKGKADDADDIDEAKQPAAQKASKAKGKPKKKVLDDEMPGATDDVEPAAEPEPEPKLAKKKTGGRKRKATAAGDE